MADWILIACLKQLFAEFDVIAPGRDHTDDGSIGDAAHAREVSDHNPDETGSVPIHDADHINEVHAIDVDKDLRESDLTMEKVVQFLLGRCRSGAEKRLRYIIYNRRIWEADNGWKQRAYTGASEHTDHAHFSASYTSSLEASKASWHLEDIPVALSASDIQKVAAAVWAMKIGDSAWPSRNALATLHDLSQMRDVEVSGGAAAGHQPNTIPADSPLAQLLALPAVVEKLSATVAELSAKVDALGG